MTLKARLARLESAQAGGARVIVLDGPKGLDVDAELRARGIVALPRDLVVTIADPVTDRVDVTVDGVPVHLA